MLSGVSRLEGKILWTTVLDRARVMILREIERVRE